MVPSRQRPNYRSGGSTRIGAHTTMESNSTVDGHPLVLSFPSLSHSLLSLSPPRQSHPTLINMASSPHYSSDLEKSHDETTYSHDKGSEIVTSQVAVTDEEIVHEKGPVFRWLKKIFAMGVEARGIEVSRLEKLRRAKRAQARFGRISPHLPYFSLSLLFLQRVPEEERSDKHSLNLLLFWFSVNTGSSNFSFFSSFLFVVSRWSRRLFDLVPSVDLLLPSFLFPVLTTVPIGMLAQAYYTLTFKMACTAIVVFNIIGISCTSFIATLGPKTGLRTMVITRYSVGYVGGSIFAVLNILTQLGSFRSSLRSQTHPVPRRALTSTSLNFVSIQDSPSPLSFSEDKLSQTFRMESFLSKLESLSWESRRL